MTKRVFEFRTHSAHEIPYRTEDDSRKLGIHCNVRVIVYNGQNQRPNKIDIFSLAVYDNIWNK
jgi:hypothetical protein